MNQKTERDIVFYYLNNLLQTRLSREAERQLCDWFEENAKTLIHRSVDEEWKSEGRWLDERKEKKLPPRQKQTILQWIGDKKGILHPSPVADAISEAFQLSPESRAMITFSVYYAEIQLLTDLVDFYNKDIKRQMTVGMIGLPRRRYEQLFADQSDLIQKGFYTAKSLLDDNRSPTEMLNNLIRAGVKTPRAVHQIVLGKPQKASLRPNHFEYIAEEYTLIRNILAGAFAKNARGINILIYGAPGTGKTEMAKTLCREIGVPLYAVSQRGEERSGAQRREDLAVTLTLLRPEEKAALLMDEAEDIFGRGDISTLFGGFSNRSGSKLFMNQTLEQNAVPVIWISNDISGVDQAELRRFTRVYKMEPPDEAVQVGIWRRCARKHGVKLDKAEILRLIRRYNAVPSLIDTALQTAAITENISMVEKTIQSLRRALYGKTALEDVSAAARKHFSTKLLNCDLDLERLADRMTRFKGQNFSLCLYGVPGSGKSACARYLAERLGMKPLQKRASDLLGMFVGESEKNIAGAFEEARRKKALLILDEADSFLRDRRLARQSWEIQSVNEMLTQMENHPLPFICTTNLMEELDQASLRRFTFKARYDYLNSEQIQAAFRLFFDQNAPEAAQRFTRLTPGDFATVARSAEILEITESDRLTEMLRHEMSLKEPEQNRIGFDC